MEELKELLKHSVDGDKSVLQDQVLSALKNEAEANALITLIKSNSISKNISVEGAKMAQRQIYTLEDLFEKRIFRIPDYQRGYSWENQQLIEFWEDLSNLSKDRFQYTGMISLRELTDSEIKNEKWNDEKWLVA